MSTVLWQAADGGSEICKLERSGQGWRLSGTVLTHEKQRPIHIRYVVTVDSDWATTDVSAAVAVAESDPRELRELDGLWPAPSRRRELASCVDVDLSFTPATNTLPIRRLGLEVGESAEIEVAWLTWPDLEIRPARQTYRRLAEDRYLYAQADFTAELSVDQQGLVVDYEGLWRAVART